MNSKIHWLPTFPFKMNAKKFCLCGMALVTILFVPEMLQWNRVLKFKYFESFGSEADRAKHEQQIENVQDIEFLRRLSRVLLDTTYEYEKVIVGMQNILKEVWLEDNVKLLVLWIFFFLGYRKCASGKGGRVCSCEKMDDCRKTECS